MTEIRKDIKGYEWLYKISNLGNVKSFLNKNEKILTKRYTTDWYYQCVLYKKKKRKNYWVHRLVAQAFLWLNINDKTIFVCHKDDNPKNNKIDNLFLGTSKDNAQDCVNKWRHCHQWKKWKLSWNSKITYQYNLNWNFIKKWFSQSDIKRQLLINQANISAVCNWERKTAGWFIWKYKKDD